MEYGKRTCCVCGKEFEMSKDIRYTAVSTGWFDNTRYDAIDCPYCGCQNVLQERKFKENDETNESSGEES